MWKKALKRKMSDWLRDAIYYCDEAALSFMDRNDEARYLLRITQILVYKTIMDVKVDMGLDWDEVFNEQEKKDFKYLYQKMKRLEQELDLRFTY